MKSFFKKLAFVMALAMVVSLAAPAAQSAFAATEFTYAEQESSEKVTSLSMKAGDEVDLKFLGVKDYKNYTLKWESSNEAVATVDKNGVVTAVADGVARVELKVGDGTDYVSTPVVVTVGNAMNVVLGPSKNDTFAEKSLKIGEEIDLNFYGVTDWAAGKYACTWVSTDPSVASVDKVGNVVALKAGTTNVTVVIQNKETGAVLNVTPVKFTVESEEIDKTFTVKQTAYNKVDVIFADPAAATTEVELCKIFQTSSGPAQVTWASEATTKDGVTTIKSYVNFEDGDEFVVKVGDREVPFMAYVGAITDIKVVAKTGNKEVVYADQNGNQPFKFEVTYLSAAGIEVEPYANSWMTYEALDTNDNIYIDGTNGETSYVYAVGASTRIRAVYSYYDSDYNTHEIPYEFTIVGIPAPVETISGVNASTITTELGDAGKVKWGEKDLVVGDTGYWVGLKLDSTVEKQYYVNAPVKDVAQFTQELNLGTIRFQSSNETKLLVGTEDGSLNAISAGAAVIIVQVVTTDDNGIEHVKNIGAIPVNIKAERKPTTIKLSKPSVSVITQDNTIDGALTKLTVDYEIVDQYGATYKTGANVVPSVTTKAAVGAASLNATGGDGKGKIEIDGSAYAQDKVSSITYVVEYDKIKTNLIVAPKKPSVKDGSVTTNNWAVEVGDVDANVKKEKLDENSALWATVTNYTTWSGMKAGYAQNVSIFDNNDFFKKNTTGLKKDDLVLKVTGPKGLVAQDLDNTSFVVVDGVLKIKVAELASGSCLKIMDAGKYTVELFTVTNVTANKVTEGASSSSLIANRRVAFANFEVKNTSTQLSVKAYGNTLKDTDEYGKLASTATDIKTAITEVVTLQGISGFNLTADDIVRVDGVWNSNAKKYYVQRIVVKTPINDTNSYFEQTINIGKTIDVPNVTSE